MSLAHALPGLARTVAGLSDGQMCLLHKRLRGRGLPAAPAGEPHAFSGEELKTVAEACASFLHPVRVLRYFRESLVGHLSDLFPGLARKLALLSERQFERLYRQATGRSDGLT